MDDRSFPPVRHHRLSHIPDLKVDPKIFEPRFVEGCSMGNCNAHCCRDGVFLDPQERDRILDHAAIVLRHMDPEQVHDPAQWFENRREPDPDFPSGISDGTVATPAGCVFLNSKGWCVLQKAAVAEGMHKWALKPFFCIGYPVTMNKGVLTVDDPSFANRPDCCSMVGEGAMSAYEVCTEELEHWLGHQGFAELTALNTRTNGGSPD